jgi:hypothetical protein
MHLYIHRKLRNKPEVNFVVCTNKSEEACLNSEQACSSDTRKIVLKVEEVSLNDAYA